MRKVATEKEMYAGALQLDLLKRNDRIRQLQVKVMKQQEEAEAKRIKKAEEYAALTDDERAEIERKKQKQQKLEEKHATDVASLEKIAINDNVCIRENLTTLYKAVIIDTGKGYFIKSSVKISGKDIIHRGAGSEVSLSDPSAELCLSSKPPEANYYTTVWAFRIPLYPIKGPKEVFPYFLNSVQDNEKLTHPFFLVGTRDSIMKGWLPIFKTMYSLNNWKRDSSDLTSKDNSTIEVPEEKIDDVELSEYPISQNGTYTYTMNWYAVYTGEKPRFEMKGVTDTKYIDRKITIISWIIGDKIYFKLKTNYDTAYRIFELEHIEKLIAEINNCFDTRISKQDRINVAKDRLSKTKKSIVETADYLKKVASNLALLAKEKYGKKKIPQPNDQPPPKQQEKE